MKLKVPEIMSPAGDFVCLDAALNAGADAVYFGLAGSNMRAGAKNFEIAQLKKISAECKKFGAKNYLTLNTIYFDNELGELEKIIKAAKRAGTDAVIAWDFAVLELAKKVGMPVFLSTQASVANAANIAAHFKNYGITRFVLARECTLESIILLKRSLKKYLGAKDASKISIEIFAHGAMCVSMSGRCFMSQFLCGKSANRGECTQPCRKEYFVSSEKSAPADFLVGSNYVLSPKDLCTLPFIEKLFEVGVDSLKIEGRSRNAQYVDVATSAYKTARDYFFAHRADKNFAADFSALKKDLLEGLSSVFTRGFSDGFFMGRPLADWTSTGNIAKKKKSIIGHVTNYFSRLGVAEISVDNNAFALGDTLEFEGTQTGYFKCSADSIQICGVPVSSVKKGDLVAVKVPRKVRKLDRVFMML